MSVTVHRNHPGGSVVSSRHASLTSRNWQLGSDGRDYRLPESQSARGRLDGLAGHVGADAVYRQADIPALRGEADVAGATGGGDCDCHACSIGHASIIDLVGGPRRDRHLLGTARVTAARPWPTQGGSSWTVPATVYDTEDRSAQVPATTGRAGLSFGPPEPQRADVVGVRHRDVLWRPERQVEVYRLVNGQLAAPVRYRGQARQDDSISG